MKRPKTECKYEHKLSLCKVRSLIDKLRDREPTPAWVEEFKQTLNHFDCTMDWLADIVVASNRCNHLGRRYTKHMLRDMLRNYKERHIWTKGGQKTINDHLDILVDYLSRKDDEPVIDAPESEEKPILTLKERLEKELEEGKWPKVEEKRKTQNDIRKEAGLEPIEDPKPKVFNNKGMIAVARSLTQRFHDTVQKLNELVDVPVKAPLKVRPRKIHRHHKPHTITININLGR